MIRNEKSGRPRRRSDSLSGISRIATTDVVLGPVTCLSYAFLVLFHRQGKLVILGTLIVLPAFAP
jgi:hypothetical protein